MDCAQAFSCCAAFNLPWGQAKFLVMNVFEQSSEPEAGSLRGQLLIAMPSMSDVRFARSVIYLCMHSHDDGAMGLIINQPQPNLSFRGLLSQLDLLEDGDPPVEAGIDVSSEAAVHLGGPVDTSRGFVLHSSDYFATEGTMPIDERFSLTATIDILRAIAGGTGPHHALLALGYAGWSPGQLEDEIQANGWLNCPADEHLVFDDKISDKYERALSKLGVDPTHLVSEAGHA